ncbi:hypothetical protein [Thermococcus stetteri]|uniref:hypothetical protein n=1 Tax=Thermococcus stetteri TaxID=49900 RepID=UPI001AE2469F|nr:hypothetical protein [Thermococcus stetteri]MBP1911949.1 putative alpha/beta hydrolase [Thermococcus stetteri]
MVVDVHQGQHSDFFNFLFDAFVNLFVILILSAVTGAMFYGVASYFGAAELGKALMFSTLAVVSALVFGSGALFHMSRRANRVLLLSLLTVVVLLFYFNQHALASILLGALFASCFQVKRSRNY